MKVLVTGATGQLGWDVMKELKRCGIDCRGRSPKIWISWTGRQLCSILGRTVRMRSFIVLRIQPWIRRRTNRSSVEKSMQMELPI